MIEYPRTCAVCTRSYNSQQSFSAHKKRCIKYAAEAEAHKEVIVKLKEAEVQKIMAANVTNITNNTQNITNNTVNINIKGATNLSEVFVALKSASALSPQDLKAVEKVLIMLKNEGITTPEALCTLIDEKSVTIQQLEQDIRKSNDRECEAAIDFGASEVAKIKRKAKESKQDRYQIIDTHMKHSVIHLFQNLVLKKDVEEKKLHMTSDSLATNPLYLSRDGLSVWSQKKGIEQDSRTEKFGTPDKNQLCSWLLVQEDRLWRTLIMDILISRLERYIIEDHTGPLQEVKKKPEIEDPTLYLMMRSASTNEKEDEEEEHYIGGCRYVGKYSDLMNRLRDFKNAGIGKDAFLSSVILELKRVLGEACKQLPQKGWFHLTNKVSEQKQSEQELIGGVLQLSIEA